MAFVGACRIGIGRGGLTSATIPRRQYVEAMRPVRVLTRMTAVSPEVTTKIHITGNNMELTDALRNYVTEKVGKSIQKTAQFITKVDVHLSVAHNPSIKHNQAVEVVVFARGAVMRAEVKMESAYASVDLVSDKIARKMRKYKERKERKGDRNFEKTTEIAIEYQETLVEEGEADFEEESVELDLYEVIKTKEFQMPLQTVADAAVCLEYIDHDFYVFREHESGEVNVLYKRNHGGLGLIKPEKA